MIQYAPYGYGCCSATQPPFLNRSCLWIERVQNTSPVLREGCLPSQGPPDPCMASHLTILHLLSNQATPYEKTFFGNSATLVRSKTYVRGELSAPAQVWEPLLPPQGRGVAVSWAALVVLTRHQPAGPSCTSSLPR